MKILILQGTVAQKTIVKKGQVIEVSDDEGALLIRLGKAEVASEMPAPEPAPAPVPPPAPKDDKKKLKK